MVGKVLKANDNPLADRVKEAIRDGAWSLVEFEDGVQLMVNRRHRFDKVREHDGGLL